MRETTPRRAPTKPVNPVEAFKAPAAELFVPVLLVADADADDEALESRTLSKETVCV